MGQYTYIGITSPIHLLLATPRVQNGLSVGGGVLRCVTLSPPSCNYVIRGDTMLKRGECQYCHRIMTMEADTNEIVGKEDIPTGEGKAFTCIHNKCHYLICPICVEITRQLLNNILSEKR
jgi:hypothetical protein